MRVGERYTVVLRIMCSLLNGRSETVLKNVYSTWEAVSAFVPSALLDNTKSRHSTPAPAKKIFTHEER